MVFCQSSSSRHTAQQTQHSWPSVLLGRPNGLELSPCGTSGSGVLHQHYWKLTTIFLSTRVSSALEFSPLLCYTNLHFTYLFISYFCRHTLREICNIGTYTVCVTNYIIKTWSQLQSVSKLWIKNKDRVGLFWDKLQQDWMKSRDEVDRQTERQTDRPVLTAKIFCIVLESVVPLLQNHHLLLSTTQQLRVFCQQIFTIYFLYFVINKNYIWWSVYYVHCESKKGPLCFCHNSGKY